jgi:signal transduction histidine kinase
VGGWRAGAQEGIGILISMTSKANASAAKDKKRRRRILMAEDHLLVREGYEVLLRDRFQVVTVGTGRAALAAADAAPFDLVTLDIVMPGMDGLQCLREMRERHPTIPIVMLTMYSTEAHADRAFQWGATDFINKREPPERLLERLEAAIEKAKEKQTPLPSQRVTSDLAQLDRDVLVDTAAAFIHKLNNQFLELAAIAKKLDALSSKNFGDEGFNAVRDLKHTIDSAQYVLERFRNTMGRHPGVLRPLELDSVLDDLRKHFSKTSGKALIWELFQRRCSVKGDYELLWHLVENLVRNGLEAVRDRKDGQVSVSVDVDRALGTVSVVVSDNGDGIAPENLPRIFDLNYSTKAKGMGIGLYLARRSAQIHGGSLNCQSEIGKGTIFTISLPLSGK